MEEENKKRWSESNIGARNSLWAQKCYKEVRSLYISKLLGLMPLKHCDQTTIITFFNDEIIRLGL